MAAPGVPQHGAASQQRGSSAPTPGYGVHMGPTYPRSPPSPTLSAPCLSQQHRPTAAPEMFEGSAEEEEFLQIQVVEGTWSPGAAKGSLG